MVNNIRDTFVATLHDLDWMDPKTKSSAKEKVCSARVYSNGRGLG